MHRPVLLVLVALATLAACSGDDPLPGASAAPGGRGPMEIPDDAVDLTGQAEVTVAITDNAYTERIIVVSAGTRVTWVNEGRNDHNVKPSEEGAFAELPTETFRDGGSGWIDFAEPGDFPYYCSIHGTPRRGQTGQVIVVG